MLKLIGSLKKIPLSLRFIFLNVAMLFGFYFTDMLRADWASMFGMAAAFTLMNFVAWISSRNYKEWK